MGIAKCVVRIFQYVIKKKTNDDGFYSDPSINYIDVVCI